MPKTKRSRNVDVQDEEDMGILRVTEDQRLFTVDKPKKTKPVLSKKERREQIKNKPLYEDKISTPIGKSKQNGVPKRTEANKYIQRLTSRIESAKKNGTTIPTNNTKKKDEDQTSGQLFDLWGSDQVDHVNPNVVKHFKKVKESLPPSSLTSVDPGQSYRPRAEDHQELLSKALEQVTKKLDPEIKAAEQIAPTAPRRPDVEVKWNYSDSEDESEENEKLQLVSDQDEERWKELSKHFSTKFTRTQRNKMKLRKDMALKRQKELKSKNKNKNFDRLQALLEGIETQEKEHQEKLEKRKKVREYQNAQPKRLGKARYEEKSIDFLYSDELPSSFRKLKPSQTLSEDIFDSFQRRNMLEARRPKPLRYRKVKYTETRAAKNFNLSYGL